jgi:hypothetical protein
MPSLRDVQQAMRRDLLEGAHGHSLWLIVDAGLAPRQRLSIYRNTMLGTLGNALRLSFPAVHALVGAEFFEGAAQIFAHEQAPCGADLNAYGAGFPDFLQRFEPAAALAYLADVARLEWAVNRALHAPDVPALDVSTLAAVGPSDHERVCFVAHPSISLLRSIFPVDTIWRAVLQEDEAAVAAIDLRSGPVCLMVHRRAADVEGDVEVERMDDAAWRFASALLGGQPIGAVIGAALDVAQGVDAPALLAEHLLAGRCVAFRVGPAEALP